MGPALATAVLTIKLSLINGLWIGKVKTADGRRLRMVIDTGSNITLIKEPNKFPDGVCLAVDEKPVCSKQPIPTSFLPQMVKVMKDAHPDGLLGQDFWLHFRRVSIDTEKKILTAEL
jgi:hypothetical protein